MATSAEEPQPCDMESPIRSLGCHISQVKVPPAATMWAQPGMDASVSVCTMASVMPAAARARQELEAVVGGQVDAEAGHVVTHRGQVRGRHHAVGQCQRVGLLRGVPALRAVGVDAVDVDPVGAPQGRVDRRAPAGRPGPAGLAVRRVAGAGRPAGPPG